MAKILVAFYKANNTNASWKDKLIAWYTNGPYSHTELILIDGNKHIMCSSSPREGMVRCKPHTIDNDSWDYVEVEISHKDIDTIKDFYNSILGMRYDWSGILGFILPTQDRTDRWFCSETVSNALKIIGFRPMWYLEPSRVSPNKLYKLLRDAGYNKMDIWQSVV